MSNNDQKDNTSEMSEMLSAELSDEFGGDGSRTDRPRVVGGIDRSASPGDRLPRKIAGGFQGLSDDLHTRAIEWRSVFRLLEQQRPLLETAEAERDRLLADLARIVPQVQETGRQLAGNLNAAKKGDLSGDLAQKFSANLAAIDELEAVSEILSANLHFLRSTWEQYARTALRAHKLRDELRVL